MAKLITVLDEWSRLENDLTGANSSYLMSTFTNNPDRDPVILHFTLIGIINVPVCDR